MKKTLKKMALACLLLFIASCAGGGTDSSLSSGSSGDSSGSTATIDTTPYAVSVAASASSYNSEDIVGNVTFDYTITINFTNMTAQYGSNDALSIDSSGVTPVTGVTVAKTSYGITITSTLTNKVKYNLTGTLSGTLTVNSSADYQLYLNGVTINATAGPALDLESSQKVYIVAASGTTSTLTDSSTRSMTMKAALYGKGTMIFSGAGTVSVTGSFKHGIFCNDYMRVIGTTLNVSVSTKDAIRTVNGFIFDDGNLTINATGTTEDDESKGVKVEGSETTGTGKGYIVLNGGYITITSVGKAITAGWDIDEDATTTSTADDPDPYVIVNNGVITLTTTGTPYEKTTTSGTTISLSPEGIEAKSRLTINSGYLIIKTTDDALNSGSTMTINGGYIYCASSKNDAIDSNGDLIINGGYIVAIGTTAPDGSFDYDDDDTSTANYFTINGGTFVGIGGVTAKPTTLNQNVVVLGSLTSGATMALKSSAGTTVFAFTIPQSYATMIFSSPDIATGTRYTIYTGGTASAGHVFSGLYLDSLSYSGGTAGTSFTVSSSITQLGGTFF